MLSNTSKYAIRALIYLSLFSTESKKVGIKEISEKLDLPTPFLGKILQVLARQKLLISSKGPNGGFALGRPAIEIPLMEIIEIIDKTDSFDDCIIRTTPCTHEAPCSIHNRIYTLRKEMKGLFTTQTIADLADEFRQDKDRIKI